MVQEALKNRHEDKLDRLERLVAANKDFPQRLDTEGFEVDYTAEDDYLRISIGKPRSAIGISLPREGDPYVMAMVDPDTYQLIGFEVPMFLAAVANQKPRSEFWLTIADLIRRAEGSTIVFPPEDAREKAERGLSDLVLA